MINFLRKSTREEESASILLGNVEDQKSEILTDRKSENQMPSFARSATGAGGRWFSNLRQESGDRSIYHEAGGAISNFSKNHGFGV